jgi:NAD(P)-dependent dehydrogenase (short-subunit alcohol dehydrogenase family)
MPVIAIVGAGPGLGLSIARRFGREGFAAALHVTPENVQPQMEFYVYGAIAAVQAVLDGMLARGHGTLLFTTGASSAVTMPSMGNVGIAGAGLRNYALAPIP